MKAYHFIAPALATVAGGFWIHRQEDTLTELEEKTRIVKERIQQFETATSSASSKAPANAQNEENDEFTLPDGTLDWKAIADLIAESDRGNGMPTNMKTMLKLQRRLMLMTEDEIEDGFSKISTLGLTEDATKQFNQALLAMLAEKNPEKALNLMGDIVISRDDPLHWVQQNAFKKFAKKDPAGALAWLDQQIKKGKFVSKALDPGENPRLKFESALLGSLLESDFATVEARLATFNEKERGELFSDTHQWRRGGKMPAEFLELARKNLTEEQATQTIANAWSGRHNAELKDVSESLKDVPFSDKERGAIVKESINNFLQDDESNENRHKIAYEWAKEQAPESAGPIIAESLARQGMRGKSLEENFQKALDLTDTFDDPSVAREFVNKYARGNDDALDDPLQTFQDPALAEKMRVIYETLPKDRE